MFFELSSLLYATVQSLMMVQRGTKHLAVCLVKHYCYSEECVRLYVDTVAT